MKLFKWKVQHRKEEEEKKAEVIRKMLKKRLAESALLEIQAYKANNIPFHHIDLDQTEDDFKEIINRLS